MSAFVEREELARWVANARPAWDAYARAVTDARRTLSRALADIERSADTATERAWTLAEQLEPGDAWRPGTGPWGTRGLMSTARAERAYRAIDRAHEAREANARDHYRAACETAWRALAASLGHDDPRALAVLGATMDDHDTIGGFIRASTTLSPLPLTHDMLEARGRLTGHSVEITRTPGVRYPYRAVCAQCGPLGPGYLARHSAEGLALGHPEAPPETYCTVPGHLHTGPCPTGRTQP